MYNKIIYFIITRPKVTVTQLNWLNRWVSELCYGDSVCYIMYFRVIKSNPQKQAFSFKLWFWSKIVNQRRGRQVSADDLGRIFQNQLWRIEWTRLSITFENLHGLSRKLEKNCIFIIIFVINNCIFSTVIKMFIYW